MREAALDFRRYAPAVLPAARNEPPKQIGELAQIGAVFGDAVRVIALCLAAFAAVLRWRAAVWFERRILRSLLAAWSLAGIGWGGFAGLVFFQIFLR